jgi:hypothetical protein
VFAQQKWMLSHPTPRHKGAKKYPMQQITGGLIATF